MYTDMQSPEMPGPVRSAEWAAFEYLKGEILSGRLPGGTPVRQEAIAARLGISRIPVRDAITHLVASGLLTYESNRRVIVTVLNEKDLVELFEMRAVLEGLAARHAIARLSDEDFSQLSWLAARMDKTEKSEDQWIPIHHEFHNLLCRRAAMTQLLVEIQRLRQRVEPYVRVLISLDGAAELRTSRHNQLVNSIARNRDPDHAEEVVRKHIEQASRTIAATIRSSQQSRERMGIGEPAAASGLKELPRRQRSDTREVKLKT